MKRHVTYLIVLDMLQIQCAYLIQRMESDPNPFALYGPGGTFAFGGKI